MQNLSIKIVSQFLILTAIIININFTTSQSTQTITTRQLQENPSSLANQFLVPQNAARATVRLPPLQWDSRLAQYAQAYANVRRNDCALRHSQGPYGENIFWGSGTGYGPA
ncbi:CAP (Cysteine-rich secretory proteins Antigen 5 and Pathogenesis-related 1 protein) superfamily protein [Euphorbia peplus]|nr:CAP (Cysteine-rich secretory proteins Antigen 5 and Pathogenesis-related 1 protein) superfamily protein [Euphorbia peplus]